MYTPENIAELKEARLRNALTQEDVAEIMMTSQSFISRLERMRLTNPRMSTLHRYAQAVGARFTSGIVVTESTGSNERR